LLLLLEQWRVSVGQLKERKEADMPYTSVYSLWFQKAPVNYPLSAILYGRNGDKENIGDSCL
jgi:hypothetical protein